MPYCQLFYHMVWATKGRLPLITPEIEADIDKLLAAKAKELGGRVYALNGERIIGIWSQQSHPRLPWPVSSAR